MYAAPSTMAASVSVTGMLKLRKLPNPVAVKSLEDTCVTSICAYAAAYMHKKALSINSFLTRFICDNIKIDAIKIEIFSCLQKHHRKVARKRWVDDDFFLSRGHIML